MSVRLAGKVFRVCISIAMLNSQMVSVIWITVSLSWFAVFGFSTSQPSHKINQYFRLDEQSDSWVPVELPYNLVKCIDDNCTVVGSIREVEEKRVDRTGEVIENVNYGKKVKMIYKKLLPVRKRTSFTKMSETSLWITGESGSIYERFWNGVHWVIAPHDLPSSAGPATSVFMVNQTILALSEAGLLYQMQLTESSQLFWREYATTIGQNADGEHKDSKVKSGFVTNDGEKVYFCTKNGSLLELVQTDPPRWQNHGQPPGADVAAIADASTVRQNLVFTVSSAGELYEHDKSTKPPWKKHLRKEGLPEDTSLIPSRGCIAKGLVGTSVSLFLISKAGMLIERRLYRRKWKWISHGTSENQLLTSITPVLMDESSEKYSLFLTTVAGSVLEYQMIKQAGGTQETQIGETWVNHLHPLHAKIARGIPGTSYPFGRLFFPLDDGRVAELHFSGFGGENSGPSYQVNIRKKGLLKYVWSVFDVPETEGWNAEYCTEERGPFNCMMGVKDETTDLAISRTVSRRQKGLPHNYLIPESSSVNHGKTEEHKLPENLVNSNFRMRVMQGGRSFFLVTVSGLTFEFLYSNDVGVWLRHEHSTSMNGAVGSYNGSQFFVDIHGSLLIRERSNNELQWINCTAMKNGRQIISGPPWDMVYGTTQKITASDALYFVSKNGRLLQFTVAQKIFKWKDCKNPGNTKVASIVDQEMFRYKVVFVAGTDGRLYQYNTLYGQWHEHYQSQHLVLSRLPGTAARQLTPSLKGSLFMITEDGGLVEYHWNSLEGWMWIEHGTPHGEVNFLGATGPSFDGHQLFLVGSDGKVYLRYFNFGEWKWRDLGYPDSENAIAEQDRQIDSKHQNKGMCVDAGDVDDKNDLQMHKRKNKNCNPKVSSTRPIPSAEDKIIFELRDGRLGEIYRVKDFDWIWLRIIATPTSVCSANFWAAGAS